MPNPELEKKWATIRGFFKNAHASLMEQPEPALSAVTGLLTEFEHFLAHNELELALDSLAEAGRLSSPRARFWDSLRQAAEQMALLEKTKEFQFLWVEAASQGLSRKPGPK